MRRIRLFITSSLDGYIARSDGAVDWLFTDQDYGYTEFLAQVDTVIMGRTTYEQVLGFGEYPYTSKRGIVISQTRSGQRDQHVEFVGSDLRTFVEALRQAEGQDIWLVGGATVIDWFLRQGLIDELLLFVHPLLLGEGIPLFQRDATLATPLILKQTQTFSSGMVQLAYDLGKPA